MSDLVMPHSNDAEESVLGGILLHGRTFAEVAPRLAADDFYHPARAAVFEAMVEVDKASKPIDAVTVLEQMRAMGTVDKLHAFGDAGYLADLVAMVVTVEGLEHHADIVRLRAERRRRIVAFRELAAAGFAESDDAEYLADCDKRMLEISTGRSVDDPEHVKVALREMTQDLSYKQDHANQPTAVRFGWSGVDELVQVEPGDLVVVGARPKIGKTALVLNAVVNAAKLGHPILIFNFEMRRRALAARMVSSEARIDGEDLRRGKLSIPEWKRLGSASSDIANLPIHLDDKCRDVSQVRGLARRWLLKRKPKGPTPVVVIDYLQLLLGETKRGSNRAEKVGGDSRALKQLAYETESVVIALSQLNRSLESRDDKRPMLSDLRESGAIEQDADIIAFLYRDEFYHGPANCQHADCERCARNRGKAEFIVGAQRNGRTGTVPLAWLDRFTRFEALAEDHLVEQERPRIPPPRGRGTYHEPDRERE